MISPSPSPSIIDYPLMQTVSTIGTVILSMILNPEIQEKARDEIDRVIPNGNLPSFEDQDSLPYVTAIVWEAFRWRPVTPMGLVAQLKYDMLF
jgi:cytochrome P450